MTDEDMGRISSLKQQGKSAAAIAEMLDLPANTVKSYLRRHPGTEDAWQRAAPMTRETSCHCASRAMQGFMQSVATAGISVKVSCAGSLWRFLPAGRGG